MSRQAQEATERLLATEERWSKELEQLRENYDQQVGDKTKKSFGLSAFR